jgi:uncharacterized pyridoxamine 5'-phosphate oxidase family protein
VLPPKSEIFVKNSFFLYVCTKTSKQVFFGLKENKNNDQIGKNKKLNLDLI